ncbi:hypothetical protein PXNS11_320009 [Stutzerimonas xanthomarina]|nr:hypothetical protein PXNS11_320009 [Stutzerimonas xanthomarina]
MRGSSVLEGLRRSLKHSMQTFLSCEIDPLLWRPQGHAVYLPAHYNCPAFRAALSTHFAGSALLKARGLAIRE